MKKIIDWKTIGQVLKKIIWIEEDDTFGIEAKENLERRTEQLVRVIKKVIKDNTTEEEVEIKTAEGRRTDKIKQ